MLWVGQFCDDVYYEFVFDGIVCMAMLDRKQSLELGVLQYCSEGFLVHIFYSIPHFAGIQLTSFIGDFTFTSFQKGMVSTLNNLGIPLDYQFLRVLSATATSSRKHRIPSDLRS
jgi:hypothetical protein